MAARSDQPKIPPELAHVPPVLIKAQTDWYGYALGTTDGITVEFHRAEILSSGWVRLHSRLPGGFTEKMLTGVTFSRNGKDRYHFPRGIDVPIDMIAWCSIVQRDG